MIKLTHLDSSTILMIVYTRKQALACGDLVDLTHEVQAHDLHIPFACTDAVWKTIEWPDDLKPGAGQSTEGRLHDVLMRAVCAVCADIDNPRVSFDCHMVQQEGAGMTPKKLAFLLTLGSGDEGEPVATLMLSS